MRLDLPNFVEPEECSESDCEQVDSTFMCSGRGEREEGEDVVWLVFFILYSTLNKHDILINMKGRTLRRDGVMFDEG